MRSFFKKSIFLILHQKFNFFKWEDISICVYPPASEASRKVANLTERKNPHTPVYCVKEFVCLSIRLLQTLTPIISGLAEQNGLKFFYDMQTLFLVQHVKVAEQLCNVVEMNWTEYLYVSVFIFKV